jgi:hypothetical protein
MISAPLSLSLVQSSIQAPLRRILSAQAGATIPMTAAAMAGIQVEATVEAGIALDTIFAGISIV